MNNFNFFHKPTENPHVPTVMDSRNIDTDLTSTEVKELLRNQSRDSIRNMPDLVTNYSDKDDVSTMRSRSILYKPYYDHFTYQRRPFLQALQDRFDRNKRAVMTELNDNSFSEWIGLCKVRWTQIVKQSIASAMFRSNVETNSGSICRSFDILAGFGMCMWAWRIYYCKRRHLRKWNSGLWSLAAFPVFPYIGFRLMFLEPCQEDMRVCYNYNKFQQPRLFEYGMTLVQKCENLMWNEWEHTRKIIIPEGMKSDPGRYVSIPEEFKDEHDWEALQEHGKFWQEIEKKRKEDKMAIRYTDRERSSYFSMVIDTFEGEGGGRTDIRNIPYLAKRMGEVKPNDIKMAYEESKRAKKEKEEEDKSLKGDDESDS